MPLLLLVLLLVDLLVMVLVLLLLLLGLVLEVALLLQQQVHCSQLVMEGGLVCLQVGVLVYLEFHLQLRVAVAVKLMVQLVQLVLQL